ncbi:MAG: hypothetical protein ABJE47_13605 [bacterium]
MAETKRPNYFTSQFLVDKDFNDEQAYHLNARRLHDRLLHTSGVAEGLDITFVGPTQVQVGVGSAIDASGRQIIIGDALTYTLATAGNDLDVFITIAYQEVFDPADHYTQAGLDKFIRTTERPLVQDGTAVPPTDGSVIVLARVKLDGSGAIAAATSIDTSIRTLAGAQLAPSSVTLAKLALDARPLNVQGANAITVATDTTQRLVTIGESHSAHTDNPHATTAAQVDAQGGANQIVAQINAGSGVIVRAHLESTVVSGVVTFVNLAPGIEMFSDDIDPGFGAGALAVQLALEDSPSVNITLSGDTNYFRAVQLRSQIDRSTGRFKIFISRNTGSFTATAAVRWYAFKPQIGSNANVGIGAVVSPNTANLISNTTQSLSVVVGNTTTAGVTWKIREQNGGTLSSTTPLSTIYSPPLLTGTYHVDATSLADPSVAGTATINVNADITVQVTPGPAVTVLSGAILNFSATVLNNANGGVTWSTTGGSVFQTTGSTATYTAPPTPGVFSVTAASVVDPSKTASVTITVPPVTFSIAADASTVTAGSSTIVRATVTGTTDNRANWVSVSQAASVSPSVGPTTTWFAPGVGGSFDVKGTSVADPNQSQIITINVPNVKNDGGGGGGGGKFAPPTQENLAFSSVAPPDATAPASTAPEVAPPAGESADAVDKARAFVKPKKRASTKLPPEPSDS